ncbi:MAG: MraY family glycosyltransferase [Planctomycetota bacterium]
MPPNYTTLGEEVRAYWPILACAFAVSLVATPLCRRYALHKNIVDRPDEFLKPHKRPIPYLGGVAIFLGWAAGILFALALFAATPHPTAGARGPSLNTMHTLGILTAGLAITLLGLFDDLHLASPVVKLAGGMVVAVILVLFGLGDDTLLPFLRLIGAHSENLPRVLVLTVSVPFTVFIVLGACNATNLIDGLDGLCSGVLGIMAAGFLVLAADLHLWNDWRPLDVERVVISSAMMGAALGFLPYNRNPAKIFMGDAGSMLLGLNAAILLLLFAKSSETIRWMLGSLMMFGLPLADMVLTLARRRRNQRPLMVGDRSHFYDQLVDRGWPIQRVVRVSYALAAFFALMGCAPIVLRLRYVVPLYMLVVAGVVALVVKFKMVRVEPLQPSEPRL